MKKTLLFAVICCILAVTVQNVAAAENVYTENLRVGLSYGSSAKSEAWFFSESPIYITDLYYDDLIATVPENAKFCISAYAENFACDYFEGLYAHVRLESESVITYNDVPYRGSFELKLAEDKITVINIVNTEDYLASVLGREMSASWPKEALKAQAVCARNFAFTTAGKHSAYGFDICATQDCQVYGGVSSEAETTRSAVRETEGVTVTYDGEIVPLYYFSCDGGYTEDSENVWKNALGYLRGKKDIYENAEYATRYNWSKSMTKAEIESVLAQKGVDIGELIDVKIESTSGNNGVTELTFVGTTGEKTYKNSATRTALSLYSQAYTIEKSKSAPVETEYEETVLSCVLTANGVAQVTNPENVMTGSGMQKLTYNRLTSEEAPYYDVYTFVGHGWGHLVGMSQWGAYSMAMMGYTYEDILNFYYTDIVIEQADVASEQSGERAENDEYSEIQWSEDGI